MGEFHEWWEAKDPTGVEEDKVVSIDH